jgi:hypothetical protein
MFAPFLPPPPPWRSITVRWFTHTEWKWGRVIGTSAKSACEGSSVSAHRDVCSVSVYCTLVMIWQGKIRPDSRKCMTCDRCVQLKILLNQLYNPGWVLACSTSSILVLQFVIFIARRSASTSSFHLVWGLSRDLPSMGFHFIIALTFLSSILFTWPYHANLWDFINRSIFSSFVCASISWFVLTLHSLFESS